jgi:hypothetical protein
MEYREILNDSQLVNRSDGVVDSVYIAGELVWHGVELQPILGKKKLGRALRFSGR